MGFVFQRVAVSSAPPRPRDVSDVATTSIFSRCAARGNVAAALLTSLDLQKMDDNGMYLWAGILTVVGLAASFGIAIWWQRRKKES